MPTCGGVVRVGVTLLNGKISFGGEESAGVSLLQFDGSVWTTDEDGLILCVLAAEIPARTGDDSAVHLRAADASLRRAGLQAHRLAGDVGREGQARAAVAR